MAAQPDFKSKKVVYQLGDITSRDALTRAIKTHGVTHIIHAAAVKHVTIAERQPAEAIEVNVNGSRNVLQVASENEVKRVILVSTDKAAQPTNTYGLTKALMERLMAEYDGMDGMTVNTTRFGNLIGSRGSVLDLFMAQIKDSGVVTVTNPEMTRFFIRIVHAASTVIEALEVAEHGLVFIPNMRAAKLADLVTAVFEFCKVPKQINLVGARPGEKTHELVLGVDELTRTTRLASFDGVVLAAKPVAKPVLTEAISSQTSKFMDSEEMLGMIREVNPKLALV